LLFFCTTTHIKVKTTNKNTSKIVKTSKNINVIEKILTLSIGDDTICSNLVKITKLLQMNCFKDEIIQIKITKDDFQKVAQ